MRLQREGVTIRWRRVCELDHEVLGPFELSVCWWLGREWYFL